MLGALKNGTDNCLALREQSHLVQSRLVQSRPVLEQPGEKTEQLRVRRQEQLRTGESRTEDKGPEAGEAGTVEESLPGKRRASQGLASRSGMGLDPIRGRKPARKSFQGIGEETGGLEGVTAMEVLRGGCDVDRYRIRCALDQMLRGRKAPSLTEGSSD